MRKLLLTLGLIALFAGTLHAQIGGMGGTAGVSGVAGFGTPPLPPTADAPVFSPVAGAVADPTIVTASTSTSGCGSYIYFDANPTPVTNQTTYTVTVGITLYAYVHLCPGYGDSTISSAIYTISVPGPEVVQSIGSSSFMNFGSGTLTYISPLTPGNNAQVLLICRNASAATATDNQGNVLTEVSNASVPLTCVGNSGSYCSGDTIHLFAETVPSGPSVNAINFTFSGSYASAIGIEVSNPSTGYQAVTGDAYLSGDYEPSVAVTPTSSPSLGLGLYVSSAANPTYFTPGAGWTLAAYDNNTNGMWLEWQSISGTSPVTATVTNTEILDYPNAWAIIW